MPDCHSHRRSLKKKGHDLSAQIVRAIHEAEFNTRSTYPSNGFACTLPALGWEPSERAPSMRVRRFSRAI